MYIDSGIVDKTPCIFRIVLIDVRFLEDFQMSSIRTKLAKIDEEYVRIVVKIVAVIKLNCFTPTNPAFTSMVAKLFELPFEKYNF